MGGGAPRQSDIPTLYQISHICTILLCIYIRVGRVGEWGGGMGGGVGLLDNQIFPSCIKFPTFVPICIQGLGEWGNG